MIREVQKECGDAVGPGLWLGGGLSKGREWRGRWVWVGEGRVLLPEWWVKE